MKAFVDPWTLLELELTRSSQIVCTECQKEKQRKKGEKKYRSTLKVLTLEMEKSVNVPTEQVWGLTLDSPYCLCLLLNG